jgi:hypothetical protein|tara:strand:+ start:20 stop:265 length:246 start_codon:yes stop_codon:yes gene_type:complete
MKEDKFKLQKETVEFLKPTSKKLGESTEFKGSKSVSITRFSGGNKGMMIQLTDKKRGNIQMPVQEAVILGRALQNKDLMKA